MKHSVTITNAAGGITFKARRLIKKVIITALKTEGVNQPCSVNVLMVDDDAIRELNNRFREIDRSTDVLSFPMLELEPENPVIPEDEIDPETGFCPLGDIVISVQRARAQAEEFGNSFERELAYLTVHSMMHLLGYDHVDEGEMKKQMRRHEEMTLEKMGLTR